MTQICIKCNHEKEMDRFTKGHKTCKFCTYLQKHQFVYPDDWDKQVVEQMLEMIFDGKITYLNELEIIANKPVEEIISLILNDLKVHNIGNRKLMAQKECQICGRKFDITIGYYNSHKFCSHECYSKYRSLYLIGEKASVYNKTKQYCTYCGKEMMLPLNKLKTTNKEGLNHHFCSRDCYYNFRKEYYVGDRLYNNGIHLSEKQKDICRINTVLSYQSGKLNRQTIPQQLVNQMLDELRVAYINEKSYKYYAVDNYLVDKDLIIEVMGDYFHANPQIYSFEDINAMQRKDVARDARKRTYINKYYNINILYLWETDIKENYEKCKSLITKYISSHGVLDDYQSYNYNDNLFLKEKIVNPYFIKNP